MYSHPSTGNNIVSRWTVASDFSTASAELELMDVTQPAGNHNGGYLGFSPSDTFLYITFGDGGASNDAYDKGQDMTDVLGSIVRIDVDSTPDAGKAYAVPSSNPFNSDGDANTLGEIFVAGLRNPFRCSFDRADTTKLYCGDVGQNAWEEVDVIDTADIVSTQETLNLGWPIFEGLRCNVNSAKLPVNQTYCDSQEVAFGAKAKPIFQYENNGGTSAIGGFVYRGSADSRLVGRYVFADYLRCFGWDAGSRRYTSSACSARTLHMLDRLTPCDDTCKLMGETDATERPWHTQLNMKLEGASTVSSTIYSFAEDLDGELYVIQPNRVLKVVAPGNCQIATTMPPATTTTSTAAPTTTTTTTTKAPTTSTTTTKATTTSTTTTAAATTTTTKAATTTTTTTTKASTTTPAPTTTTAAPTSTTAAAPATTTVAGTPGASTTTAAPGTSTSTTAAATTTSTSTAPTTTTTTEPPTPMPTPDPNPDIIVDGSAIVKSTGWQTFNHTSAFGMTSLFTGATIPTASPKSALFPATLSTLGVWSVYQWTACQTGRSSFVPHTVRQAFQIIDRQLVDQNCTTGTTGQWTKLGSYNFTATSVDVIVSSGVTDSAGKSVGADAVRFEYTPTATVSPPYVPPTPAPTPMPTTTTTTTTTAAPTTTASTTAAPSTTAPVSTTNVGTTTSGTASQTTAVTSSSSTTATVTATTSTSGTPATPSPPDPTSPLLQEPETLCATLPGGVAYASLDVTLDVGTTRIDNRAFAMTTRAYNGAVPGPLIRVVRQTQLSITINNNLGAETADSLLGGGRASDGGTTFDGKNHFREPNTTNVHLHGMHVSPQATADDALASIAPGASGSVAVTIETDHPTGTYWYHAHHHGSSALQLEGGLAGPLIVLDDSMLDARLRSARDLTLVLQHFGLTKGDEETGNIPQLGLSSKDSFAYDVDDKLGLGAYMLVNGQYRPHVVVQRREPVRLRVLNAGGSHFVSLTMPGACEMYLLAQDGVYLDTARVLQRLTIPPGGRFDVLVICHVVGRQWAATSRSSNYKDFLSNAAVFSQNELFALDVQATEYSGALAALIAAGDVDTVPLPSRPAHLADLSTAATPTMLPIEFSTSQMAINGARYDGSAASSIELGQVYETTTLVTDSINHPYHQHVNHFQVTSFDATATANDVLNEAGVLVGAWRDTVPVADVSPLTFRFSPHRYAGPQLFHCHVSAHADLGMLGFYNVTDMNGAQEDEPVDIFSLTDQQPKDDLAADATCAALSVTTTTSTVAATSTGVSTSNGGGSSTSVSGTASANTGSSQSGTGTVSPGATTSSSNGGDTTSNNGDGSATTTSNGDGNNTPATDATSGGTTQDPNAVIDAPSDDDDLPSWLIPVVAGVGGLCCLLLIIGLVVFLLKRKSDDGHGDNVEMSGQTNSAAIVPQDSERPVITYIDPDASSSDLTDLSDSEDVVDTALAETLNSPPDNAPGNGELNLPPPMASSDVVLPDDGDIEWLSESSSL
eukprot:CAMPEP_0168601190 /NCGR_PEP_ID=MMETSP0420-20121227/13282_1 /TAXON_ID=498008 /ORGANISM="Pessonella sp." /LENGTH=1491 /DNA_ID=CAMNT_0008639525 /DNA_START=297 /DNA_END=4772 /DNA_ORIENTATION=-